MSAWFNRSDVCLPRITGSVRMPLALSCSYLSTCFPMSTVVTLSAYGMVASHTQAGSAPAVT